MNYIILTFDDLIFVHIYYILLIYAYFRCYNTVYLESMFNGQEIYLNSYL